MEIVDNAILLLKSRDPHKVPPVIPKSRVIDQSTVAVHWGLHEVRVLRNLGFKDIPSPILRSYGWPCRYPSVFAHQKQTAAFLTLHRRAFVLSEPGTGKTLSALWAADYLMDLGLVRRVLIVCPLSIMHSAWLGDIGRSVIHRSAIVCHHSSAERRKEIIRGSYEIVITNYDGVKIVADAINKNGEFDLIIADEASYLKTHTTDRWKAFASIIRSDSYLWLMTGTPAAQAPTDAYGLAKLVSPTLLPSSFRQWQERVMNKITNFKWVPKKDAAEQVHKVLQPAIRFTKAQCLDLPPVLTETRIVEMTPQQMKYYRMIKDRAVAEAAGETISAPTAAAVVSKLLQVSSGAAYSDDHETVQFDCKTRMRAIMDVIDQTDRKVLIFALFRSSITTIVEHLEKEGVSCGEIHGGVTASERGRIIKAFQETDSPRVLVLQPQAAAHGITLTAADTVVFYGPLMSVEQYVQCCARADRQGQTSDKVTVIHIQSSSIESKMFQALSGKVADHRLLTDMFESEIKEGLTTKK